MAIGPRFRARRSRPASNRLCPNAVVKLRPRRLRFIREACVSEPARQDSRSILGRDWLDLQLDVPVNPVQLAFDKRSEEHTSELQSLMRIPFAGFCLKTNTNHKTT